MADTVSFSPLHFPAVLYDDRTKALEPCLDRLNQLNLRSLLVYALDQLRTLSFSDIAWWNDTWASAVYPGTVPSALPHLAWQFNMLGSQGWDFVGTDTARRALIKRAIPLYRLKGTLAGFKAMARLAGAEVTKAITPPCKCFAGPSLTIAERNEFMSHYPELRIYRYLNQGQRVTGAMYGKHHSFASGGLIGNSFPVLTDAASRIEPRAFLRKNGVDTELVIWERTASTHVSDWKEVHEVHEKAQITSGVNFYQTAPLRFTWKSTAKKRIYSIRVEGAYLETTDGLRKTCIQPSLEPMSAYYDEIREPGVSGGTLFFENGPRAAFYPVVSSARRRMYQSIRMFDQDVALAHRGKAVMFAGNGRLGMPHHTAELRVKIQGKVHPLVFWRYAMGYISPRKPKADLIAVLGALQTNHRLSDRVWIDTANMRPPVALPSLKFGEILCNQWTQH